MRGRGGFCSPRKYGWNGCIPAVVRSTERSSGGGTSDADGTRLVAFDSALGQIVQTVAAPEDLGGAFAPRGATVAAEGPTLFTLASQHPEGQTALVVTDLSGPRVTGSTPLPGASDEYAGILPDLGKRRPDLAYRVGIEQGGCPGNRRVSALARGTDRSSELYS